MTADDLDGQGLPEAKPSWGCGVLLLGAVFLYGAYRCIMWLATQTS